MKKSLVKWFTDAWYQEMYLSTWIMPFSMIYIDIIRFRRFLYRLGVLKTTRLPVPVVIVGNITVGGTGKTPLVIRLAELLSQNGYQPGVICRGYAGQDNKSPQSVQDTSNPLLVGDEAVLLAKRCNCPVVIGVDRVAAAKHLLAEFKCNVIISDDGLQHYALQRDIEIAVIDGERRFGNGYCLPAGPLREPPERLKQVDLVVVNQAQTLEEGEYAMVCFGEQLVNLLTNETKNLQDVGAQTCHAVAAIGNPKRFFKQLQNKGIDVIPHAFPDHANLTARDLHFHDEKPIIMTEKDAVKCLGFAKSYHWYLPISAQLSETFCQRFLNLLKDKLHG